MRFARLLAALPLVSALTCPLAGCGESEPDLAAVEKTLPPLPPVQPDAAAVAASKDPRWDPIRILIRREAAARRALHEKRRSFVGDGFTEAQLAELQPLKDQVRAASDAMQAWSMANELDEEGQRIVRAIVEEENAPAAEAPAP
jgi:hypothetical protein